MSKNSKSAPPKLARIMMAQYQEAMRRDSPNIIFLLDEQDIRKWYIGTYAMEGIWQGAEFYYSIKAPNDFPIKPPADFVSYTNTSMFDSGGKICVSIGEFHSNSWVPSLGMFGFADAAVVGGVIDYKSYATGGIRLRKSSVEQKVACARGSRKYNEERNSKIHTRFEEYIKCNPDKLVVKRLTMVRAGALAEDVDKLLSWGVTPDRVKEMLDAGAEPKNLLTLFEPAPEVTREDAPEGAPEAEPAGLAGIKILAGFTVSAEPAGIAAPAVSDSLADLLDDLGL